MRRQSALPGQLGLGGRPGQRGDRGGSGGRDSGAVIVVAVAAAAVVTVPMVVSVVPRLLGQVHSRNEVVIIVALFDPVHRRMWECFSSGMENSQICGMNSWLDCPVRENRTCIAESPELIRKGGVGVGQPCAADEPVAAQCVRGLVGLYCRKVPGASY